MLKPLAGKKVLVTGAVGSIGAALTPRLADSQVVAFDLDLDVRDLSQLVAAFEEHQPEVVFHLAGAKHAPEGELNPLEPLYVNAIGTENVLLAAQLMSKPRVVTASTCKAINPETAYGASKLIAERLTLNYENGAVARFHNVVETQGNVFDYWENSWEQHFGTYPVTDCWRYFLTKDEALSLLLYAATAERGLYSFYTGKPQSVHAIAARLYGAENLKLIPRRRGDRGHEPFSHDDELAVLFDGPIRKLVGPHAGS